jgi:hypothetical protein
MVPPDGTQHAAGMTIQNVHPAVDRSTPNKRLVDAFIQELFTHGDLSAVDRYLDHDFVNQTPRSRAVRTPLRGCGRPR